MKKILMIAVMAMFVGVFGANAQGVGTKSVHGSFDYMGNNLVKNDLELKITDLLHVYKQSYNNQDFNSLQTILSEDFYVRGADKIESLIHMYFSISRERNSKTKIIQKIEIDSIINIASDTILVKYIRTYETFKDNPSAEIICILNATNGWQILIFERWTDPKGADTFTYTFSVDTEKFDVDNLVIMNTDKTAFVENKKVKTYYEKGLRKYAELSSVQLYQNRIKIKERIGLNKIILSEVYFSNYDGTVISIGDWKKQIIAVDLSNKTSIEKDSIVSLYNNVIMPHEITEFTLEKYCGISIIENRWYADGFSEYVGYSICKENNEKMFKESYIDGRYKSEYLIYQKQDNLLDWVAGNENVNNSRTLVGQKYTYDIDSGQYGRALQFFIDFVKDYGEEPLRKIHKHFKGSKNVSQKQLLDYMSKITGEDIKARIYKY